MSSKARRSALVLPSPSPEEENKNNDEVNETFFQDNSGNIGR
jgi:hypothetical protein